MSFITDIPQIRSDYESEKEKAKRRFLERLSMMGRVFWQYTEETGETDTRSFKGLL